MAWITTKSGKRINTDWFDEDEAKKQKQIEANKQEANNKTRIEDPLHDLDKVAVSEFQNGINSVLSDFGIDPNNISYQRHEGEDLFAQVYTENGKTTVFLSDMYKDYDDVYKALNKNPYDGVKTSLPIFFNGIHEAGHILEFELNPYGKAGFSEMFSKEVVSKAQSDVRKQGISASKKSISNYAAKDNHETIAESMVDYYLNGNNANPLSIAIYNRLKGYMKGK